MSILITGAGTIGCYVARETAPRDRRVGLYDAASGADCIRFVAGQAPPTNGSSRELPALVDVNG
ncbi:MAG: hypothetical protein Q8R28_02285 [Dehalococcoidia bacterium]|nr:hypothetical protein [Dehalococcoidia bacterium]